MKPLNKTLMTSAAALIIAAGSAFAQDTATDVEVDTQVGEPLAAEADMSTEVETDLEETADATGEAIEDTANDVADAAENTAQDFEEGAEEFAADTEDAIEELGDDMADAANRVDDDLAAAADMQISALIGANVVSQTGNDVGEIDNFVMVDNEIMAVVGIGGFLGIGEHDVAISLNQLAVAETNDEGEPTEFMISGYTEEELEAMEEFDSETATVIDSELSLRTAMGS